MSQPHILEIGPVDWARAAYPDATFFSTGIDELAFQSGPRQPYSLLQLVRQLATRPPDLILLHPATRGPLHWQTLSRLVGSRNLARNFRRPLRLWAAQLVRLFRQAPLAVVDFADPAYIDRDNFFLMDRARLYFKRELPPDEWRLFTKTASDTLPSKRLRGRKRLRARLDKVRPLPLGLPRDALRDIPAPGIEKRTDVFFAGTVKGFPVRERALRELEALRGEGIVIDIPDRRLSPADFYRRCAEARLTLSPEGFGWDCFRHYEAAACGSVPVINRPTIRRYAPLVDGEHALFFDAEQGSLAATIRTALAGRERLAAMGAAARAHVLAHHTPEAVVRYVVSETLAARPGAQAALP